MERDITIRTGLRPGDIGRIIALHGEAYIDEKTHFGLNFEAFVARTVAEFVLENKASGQVWLAERGGRLVGCTAIVDRGDRGQLRWILLSPEARGAGLGRNLIDRAMAYANEQSHWREVFLETTEGLDASMSIYSKLGFEIVSQTQEKLWNEEPETLIIMAKKLQ